MARGRRGVTEGSDDGITGHGSLEWHSSGNELHNVTMISDDDGDGDEQMVEGSIPSTNADLHSSFSRKTQGYRIDSSDALPGSLAATQTVKRGSTSLISDAADVVYMATEGRESQLSRRSLAVDMDETPLATILESPTRKSQGHVGSRLSLKDQRVSSRASSDGAGLSFSRRLSHSRSSVGEGHDAAELVMDKEAAISPSRLRSSLRTSLSSVHEGRSPSEHMSTGSIRRSIKEVSASSVSSLIPPDENPPSMGGTGSSPRSSYHRGSMSGRVSHHLEEDDAITQDLTEATPQRYSELMLPEEASQDVFPTWESSAERSQRRSLQGLSTIPEASDGSSILANILETDLLERLSRGSIGSASPGDELTGQRSRRSSISGMSNRQSAARSSPRDSAPDSVSASGYGTSAVAGYRGSTTTSSGRPSHRSTTERRSQSLGESRLSHSSRENNQDDGAYDVCIDVDVVTKHDSVVVDDGNAYVVGGGYEEYHVDTSHSRRINDPNEAMMEDEKEEEEDEDDDDIFLIKDNLTSGGDIGSMTTVQFPGELPLYTAREQDASPIDNQLTTGREGLDFSFSHEDITVIAPKPDDAVSHALSARENFSFSGTGAQSPRSGDVHSLPGFNGSTQLLGSPMHVGDLDTVQPGSTDIDIVVDDGGENAKSESLSFSERVYKFVASLRTGNTSETREETQSQETNIPPTGEAECSMDNESVIPRDIMHGNEGKVGDYSSRIGNQDVNARQSDTSALIHTPMNAAPMPSSDRLQVRSDGQPMIAISHMEEETHDEGIIKRLNPVDPSSYLNSSSSSSYGVLSTPREGSSAKHAFTPPVVTNATEVDTDHESLHMTSFFASLLRDNRKYDEIPSPYDEVSNMSRVKGTSPSAKRIKLVNGKASTTPGDRMSAPDWMTVSDTLTGDASNLIHATFQSIKVLVGAKLSERGYEKDQRANDKSSDVRDRDKATDFQSLSKSLFQSSAPHRKVYEDTKALVAEMIEKLRRINDIKEQFHRCCVSLNKGSMALHKGKEVYCSLVRSSRRIAKSINESESVVALQQKLMIVKVERLTFLKHKVARLERRNQLLTAIVPKVEHLDRLVAVLLNAYTATGIRVVPLSIENQHMCWCFIISYNSDLNMKRCGRRFRRAWHNDLVRVSDLLVDELMHQPFQYHRIKLDHRYNPEINMLVYLRPSNDRIGSGIQATHARSVIRLYDDSPACGDATSTPRNRAYVPAFRSHELPSNGPSSFKSPFGSNHMICSINGVRSEMVAGFHGKEVAFTDVLEDKMEESPNPMMSHDISICDVNWEDELDHEDIRHGLRIVFTCPRVKAGGETARVWEEALLHLIEGANQRIDRLISRLGIDQTTISLLALMREVVDYGSILSARIRVVQRELLQLLTSTSSASIIASDDSMTLTTILTPKVSTRASLQCVISTKIQDLLDKGSYACAAIDTRVRALQPEYDHIAHAINAVIAGSEKHATIYDVIASACARNGHELYN